MECGRLIIGHHEIVACPLSLSQMLYVMGVPTESLTDCVNPVLKKEGFAYFWMFESDGSLLFAWEEGNQVTQAVHKTPVRYWKDYSRGLRYEN